MRKFLIATHGHFAKGIQSSLEIIVGATENVFTIEAYVNGNRSIEDEVNEILKEVKDDDELIVFTDLLGGSITNQVLKFALRDNVHVVSGLNLPLLIDVILSDTETPIREILENSISNAKEQIVYVNKLIHSTQEESSHD
jgi:fructoselysine and glucoselysine-specific PTS system IIA component